MIRSTLRSVGAVALGLILALVLVVAVEGFSAVVHPFPADFDGSHEEICEHVARYPAWVLAVVVLMWGATVFASTWLATRLGTSRHSVHGIVVGAFLLVAVIFNMAMLPYPLWFEAITLVSFLLAIYHGVKQGRG